jgi:hypothetical protein
MAGDYKTIRIEVKMHRKKRKDAPLVTIASVQYKIVVFPIERGDRRALRKDVLEGMCSEVL